MKTPLVLVVALAFGVLAGCDRNPQTPATPKATPGGTAPAPQKDMPPKSDPAPKK